MAVVTAIGDSHLASVYAAMWLDLGHQVVRVSRTGTLFTDALPVPEPGLLEVLRRAATDGRFRETGRAQPAELRGVDIVHLVEDLRVERDGRRDPAHLTALAETVTTAAQDAILVMVSSQVAVGTCATWQAAATTRGSRAAWVYLPENVQLGHGLAYSRQAQILYGSDDPDDDDAGGRTLHALVGGRRPLRRIGRLRDAEFFKHAMNTLLATVITVTGELWDLCGALGVDADAVASALSADPRVGRSLPVRKGPPYSGPTLRREVAHVVDLQRQTGAGGDVVRAVARQNATQVERCVQALRKALDPHDDVLFLGVGYKAIAAYPHDSLGTELVRAALETGRTVHAFHPGCELQDGPFAAVHWLTDLREAPARPGLVVRVCGNWPEEERINGVNCLDFTCP